MTAETDWRLDLGVDEALRAQGADPGMVRQRSPAVVRATERALEVGRGLLAPAVLERRLSVVEVSHRSIRLSSGARLTGPYVVETLFAAEEIDVLLCTIGPELEDRVRRLPDSELGHRIALDGVGTAAVNTLAGMACRRCERRAVARGLDATMPLSPGTLGWPIDPGQREVMGLLDPGEIGVRVTPSLELIPLKSVSMVIGVGPGLATGGVPCDFCDMRYSCRYRTPTPTS